MWRRLRALTGPTGYRWLALLLLSGLWTAWWQWPLASTSSWAIPGPPAGHTPTLDLAAGGRFAVVRYLEADGLRGPATVRDLATGRICLDFVGGDSKGRLASIAPDGKFTITNGRNGFSKTYAAR